MAFEHTPDDALYQILMGLGYELSMATEEEDVRRIYDQRDAVEAEISRRQIARDPDWEPRFHLDHAEGD